MLSFVFFHIWMFASSWHYPIHHWSTCSVVCLAESYIERIQRVRIEFNLCLKIKCVHLCGGLSSTVRRVSGVNGKHIINNEHLGHLLTSYTNLLQKSFAEKEENRQKTEVENDRDNCNSNKTISNEFVSLRKWWIWLMIVNFVEEWSDKCYFVCIWVIIKRKISFTLSQANH